MLALLFITIVPTLLLAASFGIAYPIVNYGKRNRQITAFLRAEKHRLTPRPAATERG